MEGIPTQCRADTPFDFAQGRHYQPLPTVQQKPDWNQPQTPDPLQASGQECPLHKQESRRSRAAAYATN